MSDSACASVRSWSLCCCRASARSARAPAAAAAPSEHGTPLDDYLDNLKTLRTTFLQTLADPHGHEIDRATGTLLVPRPGKFSWEIHPQMADADGAVGSSPARGDAAS